MRQDASPFIYASGALVIRDSLPILGQFIKFANDWT